MGTHTAFSTSRPRALTQVAPLSCTEAHCPPVQRPSVVVSQAPPAPARRGHPPVGTGHGRACWDRRLSEPCPSLLLPPCCLDRSRSSRPADGLEFFKSIFKQTKPREKQTPQHKPHQNRRLRRRTVSHGGLQRPRGHDSRGDVYAARPPVPGCSPLSGWACQARPHWAGEGSTMERPLTSSLGSAPLLPGEASRQSPGSPSSPHLWSVPVGLGHWHEAQMAAPGQPFRVPQLGGGLRDQGAAPQPDPAAGGLRAGVPTSGNMSGNE